MMLRESTLDLALLKYPALLPAIGMMCGISLSWHGFDKLSWALPAVIALITLLTFLWKKSIAKALVLSLAFLIFGYSLSQSVIKHRQEAKENSDFSVIQIEEELKKGSFRGRSIGENGGGAVKIYLAQDAALTAKDIIKTRKQARLIESPDIPHIFNYERYMMRCGISHQLWLGADDFEIIGHRRLSTLESLRNLLNQKISERFHKSEYKAIIQAFTLGIRREIPEETNEIFRRSGAMHILAVSGLHVGIVAMIVGFIFKRVFPGRSRRFLRIAAMISALWFFAALTGWSSSVSRASFMFSLFLLGRCFSERFTVSLNVLALSCLVLLSLNPLQLFDIGFQFSHLAVLGIILAYKPIKRLYSPRHPILSYAYDVMAISFCAQLFLVPLALYYFQETSIVSIVTSLVCIPVAFVILSLSLLFLISSFVSDWVADAAVYLLEGVLDFLFAFLQWFSELSWSTLAVYGMDLVALVLFYLILAVAYLIFAKGQWALRYTLIVLILSSGHYAFAKKQSVKQTPYLIAQYEEGRWKAELWIHGTQWRSEPLKSTWHQEMWAHHQGIPYTPQIIGAGSIHCGEYCLDLEDFRLYNQEGEYIWSPQEKDRKSHDTLDFITDCKTFKILKL